MVSLKPPKYMFIPFITEKRPILQLRLGYVLNEYRYKVGLQESLKFHCSEIETVEHYICDCLCLILGISAVDEGEMGWEFFRMSYVYPCRHFYVLHYSSLMG